MQVMTGTAYYPQELARHRPDLGSLLGSREKALLQQLVYLIFGNHLDERLADALLGLKAEHALGGRVGQRYPALRIGQHHFRPYMSPGILPGTRNPIPDRRSLT